MSRSFEDFLAEAGDDGERNRFRVVESPLPGQEAQEIGMLIISPQLDDRISRLSTLRGMSAGELLSRALDAFEEKTP